MRTSDLLIIGGGVVGLNLALEARRRYPDIDVTLLEKEERVGAHASGRNSGVVHAGFYYASDSLKARFTTEGNRRLKEFCTRWELPLDRCGKLVVTRRRSDLDGLDALEERGRRNGVELEGVTAAEAKEIDPRVRTVERALFSPSTATVEPRSIVSKLADLARARDVDLRLGTEYVGLERTRPGGGSGVALTSDGRIPFGYLVNAAGLYADRIARDFGFSEKHRILPFKGLYLEAPSSADVRVHVYPVPDPAYPFLGVHLTRTAAGGLKVGPTAMPAFWRENYRGLENFDLAELLAIVGRELGLLVRNDFGFRDHALREIRNYSRRRVVELAFELADLGAPARDHRVWRWGSPGIRAQLLDIEEGRLEMDFHVEGDDRSFHVLNAVSPAFTCAIPFAEFVHDEIERRLGHGAAGEE